MSAEVGPRGQSRRNFLVRLGLGAAALAGVSGGLVGRGKKEASTEDLPFPEAGSIFHPAQDPRSDPRRA